MDVGDRRQRTKRDPESRLRRTGPAERRRDLTEPWGQDTRVSRVVKRKYVQRRQTLLSKTLISRLRSGRGSRPDSGDESGNTQGHVLGRASPVRCFLTTYLLNGVLGYIFISLDILVYYSFYFFYFDLLILSILVHSSF